MPKRILAAGISAVFIFAMFTGPAEAHRRKHRHRRPAVVRVTNYPAALACIRSHEQGRDGYATNTGNGYFGAYQFNRSLWRAYHGNLLPHQVPPERQDAAAMAVLRADGGIKATRWPPAYRKCRKAAIAPS